MIFSDTFRLSHEEAHRAGVGVGITMSTVHALCTRWCELVPSTGLLPDEAATAVACIAQQPLPIPGLYRAYQSSIDSQRTGQVLIQFGSGHRLAFDVTSRTWERFCQELWRITMPLRQRYIEVFTKPELVRYNTAPTGVIARITPMVGALDVDFIVPEHLNEFRIRARVAIGENNIHAATTAIYSLSEWLPMPVTTIGCPTPAWELTVTDVAGTNNQNPRRIFSRRFWIKLRHTTHRAATELTTEYTGNISAETALLILSEAIAAGKKVYS